MKTRARNLVLVVVVLALWITSASAEIVTIGLTAEITYIEDDGLLKGQLSVGDLITGSYTYDSDTPDSSPLPTFGSYVHFGAPYGISLKAGGFVFQGDPDNVEFVVAVSNNHSGGDGYAIVSRNHLPLYDEVSVFDIEWQLDDYSGMALSSDALPMGAPLLEDWPDTWYGLGISGSTGDPRGPQYFIRSTVTSVWLVPEPATILLLGLGALATVARRTQSTESKPLEGRTE